MKGPVIEGRVTLEVWELPNKKRGATGSQWLYFTADDEAYMGLSRKHPTDMAADELLAGLERVDDDIYPEVASIDASITVAPETLGTTGIYIKRPGSTWFYLPEEFSKEGFGSECRDGGEASGKRGFLNEVLTMEKLSKRPHPYIVRYLGCRIRRGRITAIVLEALQWTIGTYAQDQPSRFAQLDKEAFLAGLESASKFMHSLGLAHNDIHASNIMVRQADDGTVTPVLIDFDTSAPLGARLPFIPSTPFARKDDPERHLSLVKHDEYSLTCLRDWWAQAEQYVRELDSEKEAGVTVDCDEDSDGECEPGIDSDEV